MKVFNKEAVLKSLQNKPYTICCVSKNLTVIKVELAFCFRQELLVYLFQTDNTK